MPLKAKHWDPWPHCLTLYFERITHTRYHWSPSFWWSWSGSNRRPSACKADALPAELQPLVLLCSLPLPLISMVGLVGFEPTTPALSRRCSNQLSYRPSGVSSFEALSTSGQPISCGYLRSLRILLLLKGGDPAAGSPTATLLRLHPSHESHRGERPPEG
jgi:hypothetical protein